MFAQSNKAREKCMHKREDEYVQKPIIAYLQIVKINCLLTRLV